MAATTVRGFFVALALLIGYVVSFAFFAIAALKPIFPNNVGIQFIHGIPVGLGAHFPVTPDLDLRGGYRRQSAGHRQIARIAQRTRCRLVRRNGGNRRWRRRHIPRTFA